MARLLLRSCHVHTIVTLHHRDVTCKPLLPLRTCQQTSACCSKIAEAEAAVFVNEKKWLVMHMHVQLKLDELRGSPNPWLTVA
jgi:hypothetical protein